MMRGSRLWFHLLVRAGRSRLFLRVAGVKAIIAMRTQYLSYFCRKEKREKKARSSADKVPKHEREALKKQATVPATEPPPAAMHPRKSDKDGRT